MLHAGQDGETSRGGGTWDERRNAIHNEKKDGVHLRVKEKKEAFDGVLQHVSIVAKHSIEYIHLKWNVSRYGNCKQFETLESCTAPAWKHPFNDARLKLGDWVLDEERRDWLEKKWKNPKKDVTKKPLCVPWLVGTNLTCTRSVRIL